MFLDRLDSSRFFARVHAFDVACPRCLVVAVIRTHRKTDYWDPASARWQCRHCRLILTIGLVAYPRKPGSRSTPFDQIPTWKESIDMRNQLMGHMMDDAKGNREPVNIMLREGCSCRYAKGRQWVDDDCPAHGLNDRERENLKKTREPKSIRKERQLLEEFNKA